MLKTLKRLAPFLLVNLLAFYCGAVFFHRVRQPQKFVIVKMTPRIGNASPYLQGVKLRGATRAMLYKQIGKPIVTKNSSSDPRHTNETQLLDNSFAWISFSPYIEANGGAEEKVSQIWFDFNYVSTTYQRKLYLTWEYKGRSYVLDETVTPDILKASFPDVIEWHGNSDKHASFILCDQAISVFFKDSKIQRATLWGVEKQN